MLDMPLLPCRGTQEGRRPQRIHAQSPPPDILVAPTVICRDSRHLYRYLTERIGALDAIDRVETAPLIRTVKRNGALLPV